VPAVSPSNWNKNGNDPWKDMNISEPNPDESSLKNEIEKEKNKRSAKRKKVNLSVWLLTFIVVMVIFVVTLPPHAHDKYGLLIPVTSTIWLVILGVVVQGYFLARGYFQLGVISALIVGTLVLIPISLLMIGGGEDDLWLMVRWLFIPGYCASFASYYLTEYLLRH